jgi:hypothetical protein
LGGELSNGAISEKICQAVLSKFKMADVKTEILLYHSIRGAVREREREREKLVY